jgi:hypothetical protein
MVMISNVISDLSTECARRDLTVPHLLALTPFLPRRTVTMTFPFAQTQYAAPDPIFELKLAYDADPCE